MLTRVKEIDEDDDKLLVEYQQDPCWSLIRSSRILLKSLDEYCDECCDENHYENRFGESLRVQVCLRESLRGSFRVWLRVCIQVCLHAQRECCVRALGNQLGVDKFDCKRIPQQCCSGQNKCKCRQRQFHHAVDANHTVEVWKTTFSYNGCRQGKTSRIVAVGETRCDKQVLESKSHSAGSTCWCKT